MDMTQIINQMLVLLLIMATGYLSGKVGYIDPATSKKLTNLILMVTTPCMILASVSTGEAAYPMETVALMFAISLVMFLLLPVLAWLLTRLLRVPPHQQNLYMFMGIFANIGFMGYPVIQTIFGAGAVFLCSILNMVCSVFLYTLGVWLMARSGGEKVRLNPKQMLNPGMLASLLALVIFGMRLALPLPVVATLSSLGSITSPLAMLIIGASLSAMPVKEIFNEPRIYAFTLLKQIAIPFACFFLLRPLLTDPLVLGVTVVVLAMPVATVSVMFANQYGGDDKLASKGVFITTICSFVTIPLLCMLLG